MTIPHMEIFFSLKQCMYGIELIFGSSLYLITINTVSLLIKLYILRALLASKTVLSSLVTSRIYLILILIGALSEDFAWIILLIKQAFITNPSFGLSAAVLFFTRAAWIFYIVEYVSLSLFLEALVEPNVRMHFRQKIFLFISLLFGAIFTYSSVTVFFALKPEPIQLLAQSIFPFYAIFILMPVSLYCALKKLKKHRTPRILKKQFLILVQFLIMPRLIFDFIQYYPFNALPGYFTSCYSIIGISTMILTIALYYCSRKVMGLRFLNFQNHVQGHRQFMFIDGFKYTLEELAKTTTIPELGHITQTFFKESFHIPSNRVSLHLRATTLEGTSSKIELSDVEKQTETFLTNTNAELKKCINKVKILIFDEIDFNNFYDPNYPDRTIISFMDSVNADIFLPIYKNNSIIGYILVERTARLAEFYSNIERDEMLIFASYLSNIINLLQNRNLESLICNEKELKEELYKKHQEINQYKESIHSFLKNAKNNDIGILFYKQRHFTFANQAAKEIIKINVNNNPGAPVTKALKAVAQQVEEYKAPYNTIIKANDERIVISGVPNLERNQVILIVYYPDFSDLIPTYIDQLKDPSDWDYLLYLETTKQGQLINQLIPGYGKNLLSYKINLLQAALSKKALLLEITSDDLKPTVELLHYISMRTNLHILTLQSQSKNADIAIKLFGINPLFAPHGEQHKPLLEKLDSNGTLCIENIEFLDLETQEYLAEFIKYGFYHIFKSNQKMASSTRIICSTKHNLQTLVQEGLFSQALFNELKKTHISMPSLLTLPESELVALAQGLAQQAIKTEDFKNLLDLNQKDRTKIVQSKPASLTELKNRVQQLLAHKSKENKIEQEIHFDPAYDISDPDLFQASRLGKHALRDQRIMCMLWNKFKNQNKIATFLGVNRSSVNRRCKEYNIQTEGPV